MIQGGRLGPWIVGAVIALLAAAVAVQGVMLYNLQRAQAAPAERIERVADSPKANSPPVQDPQLQSPYVRPQWDDWFAVSPFRDDWDPFAEMERMREQMMRMMDDTLRRFERAPFFRPGRMAPRFFSPSADIEDRGDRYVVRMDLPGVDKSDISVSLDGQVLSVSGKTSEVKDERDSAGRILRQERRTGQFQRVLTLPGPVQSEKMEAKYADGVLTITVPKASPKPEPRRVTVI